MWLWKKLLWHAWIWHAAARMNFHKMMWLWWLCCCLLLDAFCSFFGWIYQSSFACVYKFHCNIFFAYIFFAWTTKVPLLTSIKLEVYHADIKSRDKAGIGQHKNCTENQSRTKCKKNCDFKSCHISNSTAMYTLEHDIRILFVSITPYDGKYILYSHLNGNS